MRIANGVILIVLLSLMVAGTVLGASKFGVYLEDKIVAEGKGEKLDSYLTALEKFGFSGTVVVAEGDGVLLHHAYGMSDPEKGIANYTRTAFSTASVTRVFTVASIMQQMDELTIEPTDPLDRFFNDVPSDKIGITLEDLLTGSSGLTWVEDYDLTGYSHEVLVADILKRPFRFPTGEKSDFSNADFFILGRVVEVVTGLSLEAKFRREQFVTQWMNKTGVSLSFYVDSMIARGSAADVPYQTPQDYIVAHRELSGCEGVVSTVGDLYRWWKGLHDVDMVTEDARQEILALHPMESGPGAGYGWEIVPSRTGDTLRYVSGYVDPEGWGCSLYNYREANVTIIVMTNCVLGEGNPADVVARNLSAITIGDREVAAPTEAAPLDNSVER